MLEVFGFHVEQLQFVKGALDQVPAFRPFGKGPAHVAALLTASAAAKDEFLAKFTTRQTSRGQSAAAAKAGHDAAVMTYAIMKSVFKKDAASSRAIRSLPKGDQTAKQTLNRMEAISKLWAELPNPPGSDAAFIAGTLTKTAFDALLADLKANLGTCVDCEQQFQLKEGALHEVDAANEEFINGALVQGRAQFNPGTAARNVIDAIPTSPAQQPPSQAQISLAESTGAGAVLLRFDAAGATSFQVWHKGPDDAQFTEVTEVLRLGAGEPGQYAASGLAGGNHQYQIVGANSRGEGAASDIASVSVPAVAVA
jgi:hypothetical protein